MTLDDFPFFALHPGLVYLDSAATTQKPRALGAALCEFYDQHNSNIGRGAYGLAHDAHTLYEASRQTIARFVGAQGTSITFGLGATHCLNLCAHILSERIAPGSKIVLSILEHHANILPWQALAKQKSLQIVWITNWDYLAHPDAIEASEPDFFEGVSIIALPHVSNTTAEVLPVAAWASLARRKGIFSVIDGSQAVACQPISIDLIAPDFYAFSAHKLYGPMGLGVLYIAPELIETAAPPVVGGGIVEDVGLQGFTLIEGITKFEAGTPNIANVYAFSRVLEWLTHNDWPRQCQRVHALGETLKSTLLSQRTITQLKPAHATLPSSHMFSFNLQGIHAHDVGTFLDQKNICVRVGKHCAYPLHGELGVSSSVRASLGLYSTRAHCDTLASALAECFDFFS